jgi:F0F1-type ATP synthase membrane subunit c/vacuolar-type H+-ATPase subunit K
VTFDIFSGATVMTDTIIGGGAPAGPALGASFLSPQAASVVSSKPEMKSLLGRVLLFMKFRHI